MKKLSAILLLVTVAGLITSPAGAGAAPAITTPGDGAMVPGAAAVRFAGTADPGTTVDVVDSSTGSLVGSTEADSAGTWEMNEVLADGSHTVSAVEHGSIVPGDTVSFTVDAVRPVTRITGPRDQAVFAPGQAPELKGSAVDDRGVLAVQIEYWLVNKMVLRKNAPCEGCGTDTASYRDIPALSLPGYYVAKVTGIDSAGNRSETMQVTFFDSGIHSSPGQLPSTPGGPTVPKPPIIQTPNPGKQIPGVGSDPEEGTPVVIGGVAQRGERINVYETKNGDGWLGATVADGRSGRWSILTHLDGGVYGIQARGSNAQGRVSPLSVRVTFRVDELRPEIDIQQGADPIVFLPLQDVQISGTTDDDVKVIAVNLQYWLADKLVLVENAQCPACGGTRAAAWTDHPKLANPGYYYVNVIAIDAAGNHSLADSIRFIKTV